MAEVVGLLAAVLSIAETTIAARRFSRQLYRVARDAPFISDQTRERALLLKSWATAVDASHVSLEIHYPRIEGSKLHQFMIEHELPQLLREVSANLKGQFTGLKKGVARLPSRVNIWTSWKWRRLKPQFDELVIPMENLKTNLILVTNLITMEALLADEGKGHSKEAKKEM